MTAALSHRPVASRPRMPARRPLAEATVCRSCSQVQERDGEWTRVETFLYARFGVRASHGICPPCRRRLYPAFVPRRGGRHAAPLPPTDLWQSVCAACRRPRTAAGRWVTPWTHLRRRGIGCRRGLCPGCATAGQA